MLKLTHFRSFFMFMSLYVVFQIVVKNKNLICTSSKCKGYLAIPLGEKYDKLII